MPVMRGRWWLAIYLGLLALCCFALSVVTLFVQDWFAILLIGVPSLVVAYVCVAISLIWPPQNGHHEVC